jgi:hypothetical protein
MPRRPQARPTLVSQAARVSLRTLALRVGLALCTLTTFACHKSETGHGSDIGDPGLGPTGPVPASVRCESGEGHFPGAGDLKTAAERDAWLAEHGATLRQRVSSEACAESIVALVQSTDFDTHTVTIEKGYEASLGTPFRDDGRTVTLVASRVCGGAYPSSAMQVIRIPRGRVVRTEVRGGECPSGAPRPFSCRSRGTAGTLGSSSRWARTGARR